MKYDQDHRLASLPVGSVPAVGQELSGLPGRRRCSALLTDSLRLPNTHLTLHGFILNRKVDTRGTQHATGQGSRDHIPRLC